MIPVQSGRVTQSAGAAKAQLHVSEMERTLNWPAKELQRVEEVVEVSLSNISSSALALLDILSTSSDK